MSSEYLSFVHLHLNCAALAAGTVRDPPKFGIMGASEDGAQIQLKCAACEVRLTLLVHSPDNPPEALPRVQET